MARLLQRPRVRRSREGGGDGGSTTSSFSTHGNNTLSSASSSSSSPSSSPSSPTNNNNNGNSNSGNGAGRCRISSVFNGGNAAVLFAGVALGYLVLPFVLVQYVGIEHSDQHYPIVLARSGGGRQNDLYSPQPALPSGKSPGQDNDPLDGGGGGGGGGVRGGHPMYRRSSSLPAGAVADIGVAVGGKDNDYDVAEVQSRLNAQFDLLSRQSIPTATTPVIMETKALPDRDRKKILVTGGTGFVGSHLVDKLMQEGHEVIALDNFFTGRKSNVEHWLHHPNFSLIQHDVINPIHIEVDQIYHLACPASPPHYQYNPVKTIKTSTMGTINMLGLAKRVKARVLLASTSEIYGDPEMHPQKESYWGNVNTVGPRSCYDEGKRVAETMMYSYRDQSSVEVRVARIFNTFGPRMHPNDGRVVSNFIIQCLQGEDVTIYGDGSQTRSFQFVSDLVEGLYSLMNGPYDMPVNIGNPDEYSVRRFAEYIKELTKSTSEIKFMPKVKDDPSQRRPDIGTAKREIGWEPKVKVEDGLAETIAYFGRVLESEGKIIPTGPGATKPVA